MNRTRILLLALFGLLLAGPVGCGDASKEAPAEDRAAEASGQLWTCSMHPQVLQDHPGTCPICGMDLVPVGGGQPASAAGEHGDGGQPAGGERKIAYWVAPMDPTYISDKPGKSPMGMDLVPVYEDELASRGGAIIRIDPVVELNMGVRTAPVRHQTIFRHLRTIGEVKVAEDRLAVVNLRFGGWVEKLVVDRTGDPVRKGQVLFEVYSPELVSAQEELLVAIRSAGPDSDLARSARRRLELWNIDPRDIDAVIRAGEARRTLPIRSPASGYVLHKNIVEGDRAAPGEDLYRIGNLSTIWVEAEVYEFDAPWVREGQRAQMELSFQKGKVLEGRVAYVYPTLDPKSRTLRVRLEFPNPGVALKPGMFATVNIEYRRVEDALAIPLQAVIRSGRRELVFIALGKGRFAPREVVTGLEADHHLVEVLEGLTEGEEVVTSGQFLFDSESQLQEAIQKMLARKAGKPVDDQPPETVFSCPMHPEVVQEDPGQCPKCGMFLEEREATPQDLEALGYRQAGGAEEAGQGGMDHGQGDRDGTGHGGMDHGQVDHGGMDHAGHRGRR